MLEQTMHELQLRIKLNPKKSNGETTGQFFQSSLLFRWSCDATGTELCKGECNVNSCPTRDPSTQFVVCQSCPASTVVTGVH